MLFAANNSRIATYGERVLRLDLNLRREFKWPFIIADVSHPIIGADFLRCFGLLPDLRERVLRDRITEFCSRGVVKLKEIGSISTFEKDGSYASRILAEFPGITQSNVSKSRTAKYTTEHIIDTRGAPVTARARRLPPGKLAAAKLAFQTMLEAGEIRPSTSPWASPLHIVPKSGNSWRICGDYRALNAKTTPDRYPVPNIQDFNTFFSGTNIFTKLDIVRAYHQVPVAKSDIEKTAVITPFGLFEYLVMPFGLRNAAQTFQRLMDNILRDFSFAYAFIDDIIIASKGSEEHETHIRAVLGRLQEAGLTLNAGKCRFAQSDVTFLGYKVTAAGISPCTEKVRAILDFPRPENVTQLRRFLGMANFYRRCMPNVAGVQAELFGLIKTNKRNDKTPILWTDKASDAFGEMKKALANAALLAHPDDSLPIAVSTDASDTAVGAALHQIREGVNEPLAFFSRKLSETERRYSTYDRELLAIHAAIKHFRPLIEGRNFSVYTDHKPLVYAFSQKSDKASPRQLRQLEFIGQFSTDIRHVKGVENIPADTLSRIGALRAPVAVPYDELARAQQSDPELQQLLASEETSMNLKARKIPESDLLIFCDVSSGKPRPFVPEQYRRTVFGSVHNLSHPGGRVTSRLIRNRFVWPNINRDCIQWARACTACQCAKVGRHTKAPLGIFETVDRFSHVHLDIVGPLPPSRGKTYVVTLIDRTTRWPEAVPTNDISAETVGDILVKEWISKFGVPVKITTDQGRQFESDLFHKLSSALGANKIRTTGYHPQSNGKVERWHRAMKAAIMAHQTERWVDVLPMVLLGLRTAINSDTQVSPSQLAFGTELRLPGDFFADTESSEIRGAPDFVKNLRETIRGIIRPSRLHGRPKIFVSPELATASHVFLRVETQRRSLQPPYTGPYRIVSRTEHTVTIDQAGKEITVSIGRVKPAFMLRDTVEEEERPAESEPPTVPKRGRGRPKKIVRFENKSN